MVPSFSWDAFAVPPPLDMRPARNGWDYDAVTRSMPDSKSVYTPDAVEIDEEMGAVPAAVVAMPGRVRGNHPLCSFTAVGPGAGDLVSGQGPLDVYAPLRALAAAGGAVILMGVGLTTMTLLHLAEQTAGRALFRRWANGPDEQPIEVEVGGCSAGFGNFRHVLSPLMRETKVSQSVWRVLPARRTLEAAVHAIRQDPGVTHCGTPGCLRCNDAVRGGPISAWRASR